MPSSAVDPDGKLKRRFQRVARGVEVAEHHVHRRLMHQREPYARVILMLPRDFLHFGEAIERLAVFTQLATRGGQQNVDPALRRDVVLRAVDLFGLRQLPRRTRPVPDLHQCRPGDEVRARHQRFGGASARHALRTQREHDGIVRLGVDQFLGALDQRVRIDLIRRAARGLFVRANVRALQWHWLARTIHRSSTHVSFVPPPCEELTTSDPSRSATRHSPPGTVTTSLPDSTYGRRSIWRGAIPDSTYVGHVDSASVG